MREFIIGISIILTKTYRAMIIFFTSQLFLDLTAKLTNTSTGVFNPYLSFLFYALYVNIWA